MKWGVGILLAKFGRLMAVGGLAVLVLGAGALAPCAADPKSAPLLIGGLAPGVFHTLEVPTNAARDLSQWRYLLRKFKRERDAYLMCDGAGSLCAPRVRKWRALLRALKGQNQAVILQRLNRDINNLVRYGTDRDIWDREDRWASPMETLEVGGDCEDIAFLKYASLLELGFAEADLRLVLVRDKALRRDHAILAVRRGSKAFILDNITDAVSRDREFSQYKPLYSLSGERRWLHVAYRVSVHKS